MLDPNINFSKFFAIFIVKFLIIECSFAQKYCPEDLELKPRGTSTNIKPPESCKLLYCSSNPTTNAETTNPNFHDFIFDQLELVFSVIVLCICQQIQENSEKFSIHSFGIAIILMHLHLHKIILYKLFTKLYPNSQISQFSKPIRVI